MAGKYGSASAGFLVDGYNLITAKLKALSYKIAALHDDTTGLGDSTQNSTPTGLTALTLKQSGGFFDTDTNAAHAALKDVPTSPQGTPRVICAWFAGSDVSAPFVGFAANYSQEYEVLPSTGKLTKANAAYTVSGLKEDGQIVQPLAVKTADWNTKSLATVVDYTLDTTQRVIPITSNSIANPTVVTTTVPHGLTSGDIIFIAGVSTSSPTINGQQTATVVSTTTFTVPVNVTIGGTGGTIVRANSANGGSGYQQITALSGFTGFVGKVRDSSDDITYADLVTFTNVTSAPSAERVTVAGTVDRYLSYDGNVTGSGSITAFAGFSRS